MTLSARELKLQELSDRLVQREVLYCVSVLVSDLGTLHCRDDNHKPTGGYDWEDVMNICQQSYHSCPECGGECEEGPGCDENDEDSEGWRCGDCAHFTTEEPDTEYHEALEHWIVSDWLAFKLEKRGEIVGKLHGLTIWGRCCTGQAVSLDGVMRDIATELWGSELPEEVQA